MGFSRRVSWDFREISVAFWGSKTRHKSTDLKNKKNVELE
jgi:hypothetical protein